MRRENLRATLVRWGVGCRLGRREEFYTRLSAGGQGFCGEWKQGARERLSRKLFFRAAEQGAEGADYCAGQQDDDGDQSEGDGAGGVGVTGGEPG